MYEFVYSLYTTYQPLSNHLKLLKFCFYLTEGKFT